MPLAAAPIDGDLGGIIEEDGEEGQLVEVEEREKTKITPNFTKNLGRETTAGKLVSPMKMDFNHSSEVRKGQKESKNKEL